MQDAGPEMLSIFAGAIERRSPGERAAFLDAACGPDAGLRQRIEALLRAHEEAGGFLRDRTEAGDPVATVDQLAGEGPGAVIGPYKLLEPIGEGGFGVVFLAEQTEPVRRKVALKVLKPGMDSRQVVARFEAERQALAIMDHPHIAKVFDGGATPSGRPYFVMELVKGVPITEFCDREQWTPRQRLELFVAVCQAVQHAHQKGIIHRDLKPSNVLVSRHDITPVVKVIDFGVAKALGQELTDKTLFTGVAQMVGTPLYMSPEQAGMSDLDVDTRSDVYSLGVLLYELLTGTTPFTKERFRRATYDEIRRIIREEEPPRPSTRLSELEESLPSISALRHTEPAKLTRLVRGELDWIVMKALEKDRGRRYETANGFAMDVQRYLADEPVQACPPSAGYRFMKFARRNRGGLAVAALVLFFLVLLGSGVGWELRDRAARNAKVAGQVESVLAEVDRLEGGQKWPEALAAARRAEAASAGGGADTATTQQVRARVKDLEFIDRLEQVRMQRATWLDGTFDHAGAVRGYARAFRDYGVNVEEWPVETSVDRLKARPALAIPLAAALDDWVEARWLVAGQDVAGRKGLVAVARGIDPEPLRDRLRSTWGQPASSELRDELRRLARSTAVRALHPTTLVSLARTFRRIKDSGAALRLLRDGQHVYPGDYWLNFELADALGAQKDYEGTIRFYTAAVSIRPHSTAAHNNLGIALYTQKRLDEAIAAFRKAIEIDPRHLYAYNNLGNALRAQKKLDEAIACFRKAIELDPKQADAYVNLGALLTAELSDQGQAIGCFRKAIELDPKDANAHLGLGNALAQQGKPDEAIAAFRKAIEFDPSLAYAHNNLGNALYAQDQLDEAIAAFHRAIQLDPSLALAHNGLGNALRAQKKPDEAIAAFRKAIEFDPSLAKAHYHLGNALHDRERPDEAIACYRKAIELDPSLVYAHNNLGLALRAQKRLDEAITAFRKAIQLDPRYAHAYANLGSALYAQKKPDEAIACYRKAIELDPRLAMAHANLGSSLVAQKKPDEAIACFRKAIELDPKQANAYSDLGAVLAQQGKRDEAIACFRKATEVDPKHVNAYSNLGSALANQGKLDDAVAALRKAIELDPTHANANSNLGDVLNYLAWPLATDPVPARRDPGRAVSLAKEAVERKPGRGACWNTLGIAQYRAGGWKEAVAALEKSMELGNGGDSFDWFFLAMSHWQLGQKDKAREWYDRAVHWMDKNQPKDEELRRFRAEASELLELKGKK